MEHPITYTTSQIARIAGVHPNTVRLYERIGFITAPERRPNGYRAFTELHVSQVRFVRAALKVELVHNGLRREVLAIIVAMARRRYDDALSLTKRRIEHLRRERAAAEEALRQVRMLLSQAQADKPDARDKSPLLTRKQAAARLDTTIDTLRNWEMNGLLQVGRRMNGYRVYTASDINRLFVIRALRAANYSLSSILRLLGTLDRDSEADIGQVLDSPNPEEEIVTACDHLLTSLDAAERNAFEMMDLLHRMEENPAV